MAPRKKRSKEGKVQEVVPCEHPLKGLIRCTNTIVQSDKDYANGAKEQKQYSLEKIEYFAFQAIKEAVRILDMAKTGYQELQDTNSRE
jgi:hypothetical protein